MTKDAKTGLRLRVTAAAERTARSGHPWIFADSVREQNREGEPGELAAIYDRHDRFLAVGLFDPDSPIRVRILQAGKRKPIDNTWLRGRIGEAFARREAMFDGSTTGYRCINGESDGLPGIVVDRYGETLTLKLYTAAWLPRLREMGDNLAEASEKTRSIVLRLSRNIEALAERRFGFRDGQLLAGAPVTGPVVFLENGLRLESDPCRGQKTGFFLDQRDNRQAVRQMAAGRSLLNLFSFSGGFSVAAAAGGAVSALSLDISEHALESAKRNFALNDSIPAVRNCRHETVRADAFVWLREKSGPRFDVIVIDPPSMARRENERDRAIEAYGRLIASAIERLNENGIVIACSCSAHVKKENFFGAAREAARKSGRGWEEWQTTGHAPDHAATFAEGEYLKAIYLRFGKADGKNND